MISYYIIQNVITTPKIAARPCSLFSCVRFLVYITGIAVIILLVVRKLETSPSSKEGKHLLLRGVYVEKDKAESVAGIISLRVKVSSNFVYVVFKITSLPVTTPAPLVAPTISPSVSPTLLPSAAPTIPPTANPTVAPSASPTVIPSAAPTVSPSVEPTINPTRKL